MVTKTKPAGAKAGKAEKPAQAKKEEKAITAPVEAEAKEPKTEAESQQSTPTPTIEQLHQDIQNLKTIAIQHSELIAHLQESLARKRKPVSSNNKIKIRDKQTSTVYPSKNNAYQSLLKAGELKDLVDKGLFGPNPEKNTFGWYVLEREMPDRFEEVKEG